MSSSNATRILVNKCSACHDAQVKRGLDNDFTLLDGGKLVQLNSDTALSIMLEILTDRMPKRGQKLTDQEIGEVVSFLDQLRGKAIKKKINR